MHCIFDSMHGRTEVGIQKYSNSIGVHIALAKYHTWIMTSTLAKADISRDSFIISTRARHSSMIPRGSRLWANAAESRESGDPRRRSSAESAMRERHTQSWRAKQGGVFRV
jgi:hypothetical protein